MYRAKSVIAVIVIFVLVVCVPIFTTGFKGHERPDVDHSITPIEGYASDVCVESSGYMGASHMQLLDRWRTAAVRDGQSTYINSTGQEFDISLDGTCLGCHSDREAFCDSCHRPLAVSMDCWDCHEDSKVGERQ